MATSFPSLELLNAALAAMLAEAGSGARPVFGEGPVGARLALVGEQPGDYEDRQGRPFVGPAGQLLDRALAEAGLARADVYLTNAVKQFHFSERGKRRLHRKPTTGEVSRERWWLARELELVGPAVVVALGATALLSLAGKALPVGRSRGPMPLAGWAGYVTVHPSAVLRQRDAAARAAAFASLVADLLRAAERAAA